MAAGAISDTLQLRLFLSIEIEANNMHRKVDTIGFELCRGSAWIGIAGLLAVAHQNDCRTFLCIAKLLGRLTHRVGQRCFAFRIEAPNRCHDT